ncbi:DUF3160 domain-containing protein [Rhodopirellula sp. JC639]|uniref:DUF3160 domain-containing protein n=1 Tax=Stieleria mannarensis TaxID=2755585 RepID=UPI001600322E|nr:DUF3160 domain-containing protein [Rhodopirellula sp. JC639]
MSESTDRGSNNKRRWLLIAASLLLAVVAMAFLLERIGVFGRSPRHLRERWEAGQFDLSDDERRQLRGISVEFDSFFERYADRPIEQTKLAGSRVIAPTGPVKRREQLAVFEQEPARKVAVTSETFRQFYQAYANQAHPVFITSDSILNAFHRILEDSIVKLEFRQIERLQRLLPTLEERLAVADPSADSDMIRSARRRARIVVGVARQLIDADYQPESEIRMMVRAETRRVEGGTGRSMPDRLGEPRPAFLAIDYSRFTPEGLHARSDVLRRHYRAVRWLQTIPFFVGDDEQLVAVGLIAEAAKGTDWVSFVQTYRDFFGGADDWDLQTLHSLKSDFDDSPNSIHAMRSQLLQRHGEETPSRVNDQVALVDSVSGPESLSLRVLSAFRTPEAILFQQAAESTRSLDSVGLLLCAALGSTLAAEHLAEANASDSIDQADRFDRLLSDESVYGDYLRCLATLLKPTDAAPGFMSTRHWRLKSCQTVLGGWTQMRHTFALQAKQNALILSETSYVGAGFVEPNPDFFRRLGRLASRIEALLDELGAFDINYHHLHFRLNEFARCFKLIDALEQEGIGIDEFKGQLTREDREFVFDVFYNVGASNPLLWLGADRLDDSTSRRALAAIVQVSDCIERGELPSDPAARGAILMSESSSNRVRWLRLAEICERLRDIADRQLDDQTLTAKDQQFITNYGEKLAGLLNYEAYSAASPLDDAMRCVSVLTDAERKHVHIAVGRPQAIYVLYPHQGQELLCRGAVFPYYEFADKKVVDDTSWKGRIDRATPARPGWLEPLFVDD